MGSLGGRKLPEAVVQGLPGWSHPRPPHLCLPCSFAFLGGLIVVLAVPLVERGGHSGGPVCLATCTVLRDGQ